MEKLDEYYKYCMVKHSKHMNASVYFRNLYVRTNIPVIVLSSISSFLAFYNIETDSTLYATAVGVLSGSTAVVQAVNSFLEFPAQQEKHALAAKHYVAIARSIEKQVYNKDDLLTILDSVHKKLQNIDESGIPLLPSHINERTYDHILSLRGNYEHENMRGNDMVEIEIGS